MLEPTQVLDDRQKQFLKHFSRSALTERFYLTGGTALNGFYFPYRYSEDLDFFSEKEVPLTTVVTFIKSIQDSFKFNSYDIQTVFNRNLIFLDFDKGTLKTEFTYFPFPPKSSFERYLQINIDSWEDIALNKLFTICQKPRLRDFMDLYVIMKNNDLSFNSLMRDAKIKFDWHLDPLQLGSQLLKVRLRKDKPRLVKNFDYDGMENFFDSLAKELGGEIIKN